MFIELNVYTDNGPGTAFAPQLFAVKEISVVQPGYHTNVTGTYTKITLRGGALFNIANPYPEVRDKLVKTCGVLTL